MHIGTFRFDRPGLSTPSARPVPWLAITLLVLVLAGLVAAMLHPVTAPGPDWPRLG